MKVFGSAKGGVIDALFGKARALIAMRREGGGGEVYRPDLSDGAFVARLESDFRATLPPWDEADEAGGGDFRAALLDHFGQREAPRFFLQPSDVGAAIDWVAQHRPQWRQAIIRRAQADLTQGVPLYDRLGPPVERLFEAQADPSFEEAARADTLYRYKALRMAFLPRLCLACCHGSVTAGTVEIVLRGFVSACGRQELRFGYPTDLVVTQRAIALSWSLVFLLSLRGRGDEDLEPASWLILKILFSDIDFLSRRIGQSVANNHLLVDGFAGWYLGSLFPEAKGTEVFREAGETIWLTELERQIYSDGGSFEHSTHYHEMACELALAYYLLKQRNGQELPNGFAEKLQAMLSLQAALSGPEASPLALGDATEDPMFPLDTAEGWATAALRFALIALLPGAVEAPHEDCPSLQRAFWLFGGALPREAGAGEEPAYRAFPEAGLYVIEDRELKARLVFRSGLQPGARHWAGHMHADFLSYYLSVQGQPLLVDAGTYSYRYAQKAGDEGETSWRTYFMGAQAHNTLGVPGCDPLGPCVGDFRPRETAASVAMTLRGREEAITWLEGELRGVPSLEGYHRGLIHVAGEYFILYDLFAQGPPAGACQLSFQFAPGTIIGYDGARVEASQDGRSVSLVLASQLSVGAVLEGSRAPLGGWVSSAYGRLEAAPQVLVPWQPQGRITALAMAPGKACSAISVTTDDFDDRGLVIKVRNGSVTDCFARLVHHRETSGDSEDAIGPMAGLWMRKRGQETLWTVSVGETRPGSERRLMQLVQAALTT